MHSQIPDGYDSGGWLLNAKISTILIKRRPFCESRRQASRVNDRGEIIYNEDVDCLLM
jgi:hypothetical protein